MAGTKPSRIARRLRELIGAAIHRAPAERVVSGIADPVELLRRGGRSRSVFPAKAVPSTFAGESRAPQSSRINNAGSSRARGAADACKPTAAGQSNLLQVVSHRADSRQRHREFRGPPANPLGHVFHRGRCRIYVPTRMKPRRRRESPRPHKRCAARSGDIHFENRLRIAPGAGGTGVQGWTRGPHHPGTAISATHGFDPFYWSGAHYFRRAGAILANAPSIYLPHIMIRPVHPDRRSYRDPYPAGKSLLNALIGGRVPDTCLALPEGPAGAVPEAIIGGLGRSPLTRNGVALGIYVAPGRATSSRQGPRAYGKLCHEAQFTGRPTHDARGVPANAAAWERRASYKGKSCLTNNQNPVQQPCDRKSASYSP